MTNEYRTVPLAQLAESPTNPRKFFDAAKLAELAESIRSQGVLEPLLVRPAKKGRDLFEIIVGARRYRAAKLADQADVPVRVVDLSDDEVLEVQVIENLQREDVHALEEAAGYQQLMAANKGYDVAKIAERIGRSVKYVYDRVKLLQLTPRAQKLFLEGRMSAGHAILLARLKPEDQERALRPAANAVFTHEQLLWNPDETDGKPEYLGAEGALLDEHKEPLKPRSVRELQAWIDENVRFPHDERPDPMLFPETALALEDARKIIPITHEHMLRPEVKGVGRTFTVVSWRRADGKGKSKKCDRSVLGVVVAGPGRGDAFDVCVDRERCAVHFGAVIKARQQAQKARERGDSKPAKAARRDPYEQQRKKDEERWARERREQERWSKAAPAIAQAFAAAVKKASLKPENPLVKRQLEGHRSDLRKKAAALVPVGKTTEELLRHLLFLDLVGWIVDEYRGPGELVPLGKALGLDVKKIVDEAAPETAPAARCGTCGCTEDKACDVGGVGCSWAKKPDAKTGVGTCTACVAKADRKKAKGKRTRAAA